MQTNSPTLRGRDILLVSSDDFEAGLKTSKHQLTALLARHNRVLFIESIGLRRPRAGGKDLSRIGRKLRRFLAGPQRREDHLWVFTPLAIPLHDRPWARAFNAWFLARCVRRAAARLSFRDPILWVFLPSAAGIVGRCGEALVVYYNVDDFAQFTGSDAPVVNALDEELTRRADVVFASAESLAERKRTINPNTHYLPHGVDTEHFRTALAGLPVPADIADLTGPVLCYWGWISDYFDVAVVDGMAAARPGWSVLLIGESTIDLSRLRERPNVRILGSRPYESLPAYAARSDVLLIVRRLNDLTRSMNPLKLREYLATGRPVVSSPLPEVVSSQSKYGAAVASATTAEEFVAAAERFLSTATPERPERIAALVADESWEARLAVIAAEVRAAEARRSTSDPPSLPRRGWVETQRSEYLPRRYPSTAAASSSPRCRSGSSDALDEEEEAARLRRNTLSAWGRGAAAGRGPGPMTGANRWASAVSGTPAGSACFWPCCSWGPRSRSSCALLDWGAIWAPSRAPSAALAADCATSTGATSTGGRDQRSPSTGSPRPRSSWLRRALSGRMRAWSWSAGWRPSGNGSASRPPRKPDVVSCARRLRRRTTSWR
ncbi:MAG: glycosyltransferase [Armatimonadetes bacterium]|nr:glycosyltransferase [Armatimonadota bacterium]